MVEQGGYRNVLQAHGRYALDAPDNGVSGDGLNGEDIDVNALGKRRVIVQKRRFQGVFLIYGGDHALQLVLIGIGGGELVLVPHALLEQLHEAVQILTGHEDIHVVVPRDKALVAHGTQGRTAGGHIAQAVLLTHPIDVLDDLQKARLQRLQFLRRQLVHHLRLRCDLHTLPGGEHISQLRHDSHAFFSSTQ